MVYRLNHSICSENQIYLKITSSWFHLFLLPSQYTFFSVGIFCFEFQNEWKSSKQYIKWLDLHPNIFVKQTIGMIICVAKMMWLCAGVCIWVSLSVCGAYLQKCKCRSAFVFVWFCNFRWKWIFTRESAI